MAIFLLRTSFFSTISLLASSDATAYYRPAPGRTGGIQERDQRQWILIRLYKFLAGTSKEQVLDKGLTIIIIIIIQKIVARTYPPCWVLKARIQKHRGKLLLFHDKCPGFFYVHYTTHGTYCFTSYPKDKAIMVKCLARGHK